MTNVIPIRAHNRSKPEKPRLMDNEIHRQLWEEYVGEVLALDLADKLSEPLDDPQFDDMDEAGKARLREAW